jgi:hypothetical protein
MTELCEDMLAIEERLAKLGIQKPFTIVLSKDDYVDLAIKCKADGYAWRFSQFMERHFTWQNITFRQW